MKNLILIAELMIGTVGAGVKVRSSVVVEDGVLISNSLPDWEYVCVAADVRGGPDLFYPVLYSVGVGQRVRLHELSRSDGTWVSIDAARWMPLKNLCWEGQ